MLGSLLVGVGVLATMVAPARAGPGAGNAPDRPLAPRFTSARVPNSAPSRIAGTRQEEVRTRGVAVFDGSAPGWRVAGGEGSASGVEPRIRRLVAEQLDVDAEEPVPEVSLTGELAADSLDLLELALVIEAEFAIAVPEHRINEIRTYRDLVDAVLVSLDGRQRNELTRSHALTASSRVPPAGAGASSTLERADALTPYALQIIGEDAARAGRGAHLDLTISTGAEDGDLTAIRDGLARLARRGVGVSVPRPAEVPGEAVGGMPVREE